MTPLAVVAAEYLAMILPGTPEQVATIVGLPATQVDALRREPGAARRLEKHRRRLNQYTASEPGPIPPPLPQRTPLVHAVPPVGYQTPCCGRTLARLPKADRITNNPEHVTCTNLTSGKES